MQTDIRIHDLHDFLIKIKEASLLAFGLIESGTKMDIAALVGETTYRYSGPVPDIKVLVKAWLRHVSGVQMGAILEGTIVSFQ